MSLSYRNLLYVLVGLLLSGQLMAQDPHYFVYIQSEKSQPFYIKYKGQLLSSSDKGYLILSEVPPGTTQLTVGFPKNEAPEQLFYLRVARNDQGYLLKKGDDDAYALYNLQTFSVVKSGDRKAMTPEAAAESESKLSSEEQADLARREMLTAMHKDLQDSLGGKAEITTDVKPPVKKTNSFASALDKVVKNDRPEEIPLEEPAKAAPVEGAPAGDKTAKKTDKAPLTEEEQALLKDVLAEEQKTAAASEAVEAAGAQPEAAPATQEPEKKSPKKKKKASEPDFIEFTDDKGAPVATDGAGAVVPAAAAAGAAVGSPVEIDEPGAKRKKKQRKITDRLDDTERPNNIITDTSGYGVAMHEEEPRSSRKKRKSDVDEVAVTGTPAIEDESADRKKGSLKMINSDCGNIMDDATFRKMLKKVVSAKNDEGMIDAFRRQTRSYCVETSQVRTIVQLLSAEEYKYKLLDMAYAKTYDSEKYGTLENLLSDNYYKGRFKAMLKK